jgi:hypothetical protein
VINFVPGDPELVSEIALTSSDLAGVHFTGSTTVFNSMWKTVGTNMGRYRNYPRLVGETGGKDFILAHRRPTCDALAVAIVRGGFEYQGQKCSAASRVYVPASLWPGVKERAVGMMRDIKVGDVADFRTFMGAVIDRRALERISGYLDDARRNASIIQGSGAHDDHGFFVEPTLIETRNPAYRLLSERSSGRSSRLRLPGLAVERHAEPDRPHVALCAHRRRVLHRPAPRAQAMSALRNAAGNFYVNDKPTGAVVGQQPFGGRRGSGTNDKAGSKINLMRWVSARTDEGKLRSAAQLRLSLHGRGVIFMSTIGDRYVLAGKHDHDRLRVISEIHDGRTRDLLLRAGLTSGHRFVEFGCGLGYVTRWAATQGAAVTGIDASEEQIAAAQALTREAVVDRVEFRAGSVYEPGLEPAASTSRIRAG